MDRPAIHPTLMRAIAEQERGQVALRIYEQCAKPVSRSFWLVQSHQHFHRMERNLAAYRF